MEITYVEINLVDRKSLRAYATVVFDNCFAINRLRVIREADGTYSVTMPSARIRKDLYVDIFAPLTSEMRKLIEDAVLKEFERATGTTDFRH